MADTWWESREWQAYETAYGDQPGDRAALLAEAEFNTRIVDLAQDEEALWRGVRKSYRPIIEGTEAPETIDYPSTSFHSAVGLHNQAAGRITRPERTWTIMQNWLGGHGICSLYRRRGYAYFIIDGEWSYYASAAATERGLGIPLIWWSMLALKERGVRWCELGWMDREGQTGKEKNLAFTKRGFGGRDVPARWSGRALTMKEWEACS